MALEAFARVLAAVDLGADGDGVTAGSRKALERALWIARRVGASLTILHSDAPDEYWDSATRGFIRGGAADTDRKSLIERALASLPHDGVEIDVVIRSESAWLAIVREVLRRKIDVVLAGKRTLVDSDDRRLGAVARKLLRKCPCAVWLEDPRDARGLSVLLAATDLTPVGDRVVALSASIAHVLGAQLHVVHAFSISLEAQFEGDEATRDYEKREHARATAEIERVLATTPMAGEAEIHVGATSPAQAILDGVDRLHPGLVALGTVSRGGIAGLLMGNTAERLVDRIDCALLAIKPEDFVCPVEAD